MAEKLAFQKGFRQGGTVDLDKRIFATRAVVVDGIGDELFSCSAFTGDEYSGISRC
jgi:hypothetical protein